MKTCMNCGWENADEYQYCVQCGDHLPQNEEWAARSVVDEVIFDTEVMEVDDPTEEPVARISKGWGDVFAVGALFYGKYMLKEKLAEGYLCDVWRATDVNTDRDVVIKMAVRHWGEILKEEFFLLVDLHHERIVHPDFFGRYRHYTRGEWIEETYFYVMPYYEGGSVYRLRGKMQEDMALQLLHDVAEGLEYLRQQGICHGAIMPEHILIDGDGHFVIGGFPLNYRKAGRTLTGKDRETYWRELNYGAPELAKAGYIETPVCDMWSLGVCLHELLTGKLPSTDDNRQYCHVADGISLLLEWYILRCLADMKERLPAAFPAAVKGLRIIYSEVNGKYGLIDVSGRLALDFIYDTISPFRLFTLPHGGPLPPVDNSSFYFMGAFFERGDHCGFIRIDTDTPYEYRVYTREEYRHRNAFT